MPWKSLKKVKKRSLLLIVESRPLTKAGLFLSKGHLGFLNGYENWLNEAINRDSLFWAPSAPGAAAMPRAPKLRAARLRMRAKAARLPVRK